MAEFINRRLSNDDLGVSGTLQAATDWDEFDDNYSGTSDPSSPQSINRAYKGLTNMIATPSASYPNPKAAKGSRLAGIPGYVMQSDILQGIGSSLTVRGDTFLIRAYGESLSTGGKVAAFAYCEAIVQRQPEYIDSTDPAEKYLRQLDGSPKSTLDLTTLNKTFGRQFRIISFRWLSPNEI